MCGKERVAESSWLTAEQAQILIERFLPSNAAEDLTASWLHGMHKRTMTAFCRARIRSLVTVLFHRGVGRGGGLGRGLGDGVGLAVGVGVIVGVGVVVGVTVGVGAGPDSSNA